MDITFLIGNGFDLNLGLNTTYMDFVNYYKNTESGSKILEKFRNHIKDTEELWRNAEIALGKYTAEFTKGSGLDFSECQKDFCEKLVEYLKEQESRLHFENFKEKILTAFKKLSTPEESFPDQIKKTIRGIIDKYSYQEYVFNFINFNYTSTLSNCLEIIKKSPGALGQHRSGGGHTFVHGVKQICPVHGTVEKNLVFAVNDETQIAKPDIFDFEDGEICKNLLIKRQANEAYQENTDIIANQILQNSTIIYIWNVSRRNRCTLVESYM